MTTWSQEVTRALAEPLSSSVGQLRELGGGLDSYRLTLEFPRPVPAGHAAGEIIWIDRAFRYAAKAYELGETIEEHAARGGAAIFIADGLRYAAVDPGSVRTVLTPSSKVRNGGFVVLVGAVALLSDSLNIVDKITGARPVAPSNESYVIQIPETVPDLTIEIERAGETVTMRYRRSGEFYGRLVDRPPGLPGE